MESEMNQWHLFAHKKPHWKQVCDFLFAPDFLEPGTWILCRARLADLSEYEGDPLYWRLADPIPEVRLEDLEPKE
jgi:hypothetical protein